MLKAQTLAQDALSPPPSTGRRLRTIQAALARTTTYFNLFTNSGGIPIVVDGQMIGVVGASAAAGRRRRCACAIEGPEGGLIGEHVAICAVYAATSAAER